MRVLIDTNVFISYLLTPQQESGIHALLEAALTDQYTLLLPQDVLTELKTTIQNKSYLARQISPESLDSLLSMLLLVGEEIPLIKTPFPQITRDPKDDYLIAYAVIGEAKYLVTGDKDLLVLGTFDTIQLVTPAQFIEVLER